MKGRIWPRFAVVMALFAGLMAVPGGGAEADAPTDFTYVTMSDGVEIAISVNYPAGYDASDPSFNPHTNDNSGWPTLIQIDGYGGGGDEVSTSRFQEKYVTVYMSLRGTGCSGGRFDLFDRVSSEDGKTVIDEWMPDQEWFNGDVGIVGHSYPGLTGFLVTSTRPQHLDVAALSGEIDDLYRGIVYPGGVPNYGFPAEWTVLLRPALEQAGNADRYASDPKCAEHIAERTADQNTVLGAFDNPVVQGLTSQEDDTWWQVRSTINYVDEIQVPMHLTQQYQDEQTGPRGANQLFEELTVPKRLVLTNGVHGTNAISYYDRNAWLDCWTYGNGDPSDTEWCGGDTLDPTKRVRIHFETPRGSDPAIKPAYVSSDWPLPESDWKDLYLTPGGGLSETAPGPGAAPASYVSTSSGRQMTGENGLAGNIGDTGGQVGFFDGPDQLVYETDAFGSDTAIAGPINLTLKASSTATDTDFFVDVLDVSPDGEVSYLQRGMQRASHRQLDLLRSDRIKSGPKAGEVYRYHHPHTNTTLNLLTPTVPEEFQIEIFPIGHVFRQGHKLRIQVHAPPPDDPLSIYAWYSLRAPSVNTVLHANGASRLLVPFVPAGTLPSLGAAPECGTLVGIPCFTPIDEQLGL